MDLAGLAALLAVPAGVIAAIASPIRERGLVARLQRIEKLLAEGTVAGRQRRMLENARNHLAERIAVGELQPRLVELVWVGIVLLVLGVGLGAWTMLDHTFDLDPLTHGYRVIGWIAYVLGLALFSARAIWRSLWISNNRDSDYARNERVFL